MQHGNCITAYSRTCHEKLMKWIDDSTGKDKGLQTEAIYASLKQIMDPGQILLREPMREHTTFHAGGPADFLVSPDSEAQLLELLDFCGKNEIAWMILGKGSNILVGDQGYHGIFISLKESFSGLSADRGSGMLSAGAGALLSAAAVKACHEGLSGMEFAHGIPGTVGGGVWMNAGAYGGEMRQIVTEVRAIDRSGNIVTVSGEAADFGYRSSRFQKEGMVVLSCLLKLSKEDPAVIIERMKELSVKRKEKQPLEYFSAGSTFKRPEGHFAGQLIESAGLKGYSVGDAQVSEKHAGFVINRKNATSAQIDSVCRHVQETVYRVHGIMLEMEVIKVGEF